MHNAQQGYYVTRSGKKQWDILIHNYSAFGWVHRAPRAAGPESYLIHRPAFQAGSESTANTDYYYVYNVTLYPLTGRSIIRGDCTLGEGSVVNLPDHWQFYSAFAITKSHGGLRIRSIIVEALKTCSAVRITVGGRMLTGTRVQQPGRVTQAFRVIVHLNPGNKSEEKEYYAGSYFFAGKQVLSFLAELQINQKNSHFSTVLRLSQKARY